MTKVVFSQNVNIGAFLLEFGAPWPKIHQQFNSKFLALIPLHVHYCQLNTPKEGSQLIMRKLLLLDFECIGRYLAPLKGEDVVPSGELLWVTASPVANNEIS